MQELQALQRIYIKIAQVVRIRQRLHGQREAVLFVIMQKMQAMPHLQGEEHTKALQGILDNSEQETSALRKVLRQEKRVFRFIETEERSADRIISNAMAQVGLQKKQIRERFGKRLSLGGQKIRVSDLQNFLDEVHNFLANLRRDIRRIRRRMTHEDKFLRHRDVSHFHKFLREWENEAKAFKRMLNDLEKVVDSTPRFVRGINIPLACTSLPLTMMHISHDFLTLSDGAEGLKHGVEMSSPTATMVVLLIGVCVLSWGMIKDLTDSLTSEDTAWDVTRERRILGSMGNASR